MSPSDLVDARRIIVRDPRARAIVIDIRRISANWERCTLPAVTSAKNRNQITHERDSHGRGSPNIRAITGKIQRMPDLAEGSQKEPVTGSKLG